MGEIGGGFDYDDLVAGPGDGEAELVGADAEVGIGGLRSLITWIAPPER